MRLHLYGTGCDLAVAKPARRVICRGVLGGAMDREAGIAAKVSRTLRAGHHPEIDLAARRRVCAGAGLLVEGPQRCHPITVARPSPGGGTSRVDHSRVLSALVQLRTPDWNGFLLRIQLGSWSYS
jgi:hypothetical protein